MPNSDHAFQETLDYLYTRLPVFQLQGKAAFNYKLDKTKAFLHHINAPQDKLKFIHVGGTNGKGSVSHMLCSVLMEANYRVGLYTSPHLKSFTERIKINGIEVDKAFVVDWVDKHKVYMEELKPSFFEATVAMALDYFAQQQVDIVVMEVGMGGRLDSTNVVHPELSVITNISYDHAQYLGDTLEKIAFEKAGIIKPYTPVVIGETQSEVSEVFRSTAKQQQAPIHFADSQSYRFSNTDLKGQYQQKNIQTAQAAIQLLKNHGWHMTDENIENGLLHVVRNTNLKGRWQVLQESPKIICDVGHNVAGMTYIMQQLKEEAKGQLHFVLGFVKEKEVEKVLKLLPKDGIYYFCGGQNQRLATAHELLQIASSNGLTCKEVDDVNQGIALAQSNAQPEDIIFVGGSTFIVAEIDQL